MGGQRQDGRLRHPSPDLTGLVSPSNIRRMRRKANLSHEKLVEEARFILKNLQRSDVFGDRVQLAEVERVLAPSLSVGFHEFIGFLTKYGYARLDADLRVIMVTSGGVSAAEAEDAEFHGRLARHFARELTAAASRPRSEPSAPPLSTFDASTPTSSILRPRRTLAPDNPPGNEVLDRRYRRGSQIGSGALGVVFRGRHVSVGRTIAIKEARTVFQYASYLRRDEIVRRLRAAVEAHAQLAHPYVIQLLDQNTEREHPYLVMELAQGGNLRQRLQASEQGRLPLKVAVRAFTQIALALSYGHEKGVLHLGLKPENVLFDHLGNVKLSDFGMFRILDQLEDGAPAPVMVSGNTVGYFAPERLQPSAVGPMGPTADIYALGILFYEMITGRLPGRRSPLPSEAAEGVPEAFDDVFDRMTRDAIDERYPDMDAVMDGIYSAFGQDLVFAPGSALSWTEDPGPIPQPVEDGPIEVGPNGLATGELPFDIEDDEPLDEEEANIVAALSIESSEDILPSAQEPSRPPPPPPADE